MIKGVSEISYVDTETPSEVQNLFQNNKTLIIIGIIVLLILVIRK